MPRMWDFTLRLARRDGAPLFLQIAKTISDDIRRGRLRPGERLPGTRTLAQTIGVNRVTVLAAYDELAAEGLVTTHPARGSFVASPLPLERPAPRRADGPMERRTWPAPAYAVGDGPPVTRWLPPAPGVITVPSSYPDTRLIRASVWTRTYHRVLRRSGGTLFKYSDPEGHPRLRHAIAAMIRGTRALAANPANVLITRGSQMGLSLIAHGCLKRGDVVAVEELGYRHAWAAFRQAGATLLPVRIDASGLDVTALEAAISQTRIAAVYVTPNHQLPTTVVLSEERRAQLLHLARKHGFFVIEDDYDHEFHYEGPPIAALASGDPAVVIYVGTFSKLMAPGLRIGFVAAPEVVVQRLAAHRQAIDVQGDPAIEATLAELIEEGEVQRHARRAKRIYKLRRDLMSNELRRHLSHTLTFDVPAGGIAIWARVAGGIDVDQWAAAALLRGVAFLTGRAYDLDDRPRPYLRLGFAALNDAEIRQAISRIAAGLSDTRSIPAAIPR